MQKITTKDGSITFHSKEYGETYHSVSGAIEEAFKKFAGPCRIKELAMEKGKIKRGLNILDVCFGIGYNSAAAIDAAKEANPKCRINIIALENDRKILWEIKKLVPDFRNYVLIKKAAERLEIDEDNVSIKIILGDARETIKRTKTKFGAVFLDPFSPKKCPWLWTEEFFKDIARLMKKNAVMATYSCTRKVRDNLEAAGFEVKDGPCVGRRAPGTIAIKK